LYTTACDDVHVAIVTHDVNVIILSTRSSNKLCKQCFTKDALRKVGIRRKGRRARNAINWGSGSNAQSGVQGQSPWEHCCWV